MVAVLDRVCKRESSPVSIPDGTVDVPGLKACKNAVAGLR
jgi:hypothetical protein